MDTPLNVRIFDKDGKGVVELALNPRTESAVNEIAAKLKLEYSMDVLGERSIMFRRPLGTTQGEWLSRLFTSQKYSGGV